MDDVSNGTLPTSSVAAAESQKGWSDLSTGQRVAIVVAGVAEVIMTSLALRDLLRRPATDVRGPKLLWFLGCFVQPFGAPLYLVVGRRRAQ